MKTKQSLHRLLNPRSIAVIGATTTPGKAGNCIYQQLKHSGRQLYPVHPRETAIFGDEVYRSPDDLPDNIDCSVVATPAGVAVDMIERCARKGIPFMIVVAGGFGEIGTEGGCLEEQLRTTGKKYGCRILGPNSLGIYLPHENIDTIFVEHNSKALALGGGVACIVQSGSVGVEAIGYAGNIGFGLRAFVGLGNKSDLNENDFLDYFGHEDRAATCIALYLENFEQGRNFLYRAQKIAAIKPVVVLKAGRTAAGARAVTSHTGKLAGADNVISGALKQYGIQRVWDDEELCDAARVLSNSKLPRGPRVAVVTPAGGYGVLCCDYIEKQNPRAQLCMARLSDHTKRIIKQRTFELTSCNNPVDITASATDDMFIVSLQALAEDTGVDIIICIAFFAPPGITDRLISRIAALAKKSPKPIIVLCQYGSRTDTYLKRFYRAGVTGFPSVCRAVRAARILVERAEILKRIGEK